MTFEVGWVFAEFQILKKVRLLQNDIIDQGFAERQILKKWKWHYLLNWVEYFCRLCVLARSSPRDCEMSFFIGRGFVKLQILKKWKWPYLLNWMEYYDEILHTHWHWQDVAHEIVKWHLGLIEVLPRFKFWKKWNLTVKPFGIFWCWKDLAEGIAKWHLSSVEALPSAKFWKSENGPICWTEWNILINFYINIDIDKT